MKKNLQVSGLITWMQMTLKILVILCAFTCNAQQGNQPPLPQLDKTSQDRNKPDVCFLKGNGHMYGFDDFSQIDKGKSYMTIEKSLVTQQKYGFSYFNCELSADEMAKMEFTEDIVKLHYSMDSPQYSSLTFQVENSGLSRLWCGETGRKQINVSEQSKQKAFAKLNVDVYERLNKKVLLVHVKFNKYNNSLSAESYSTTASNMYSCFEQAILTITVDEITWYLSGFHLKNSEGKVTIQKLNQLTQLFFSTYEKYSNYNYIQFESNKRLRGTAGLAITPGESSIIFPQRDSNKIFTYMPRSYAHELAHNMGCTDAEEAFFSHTLMYYNVKHNENNTRTLRYNDWRQIRNNQ